MQEVLITIAAQALGAALVALVKALVDRYLAPTAPAL
jgi:hypothetical protein